ncbi:uncharacterized protein LOC113236820 [Hyposmocoma kahamanoa]|uniref:uncharacterized protein LOC113236820 n=1 Tax=Hyposmocoma kahamanoa TaxID=1477025 RepID=UPI000E6D968B|nr:uncharacterized protein LOC113236820 [Hyposmocoma kahamanoa]
MISRRKSKFKTRPKAASSNTDSQSPAVIAEEWTKDEKFFLYQALKDFGSYDIDAICQAIPSKSKEQVAQAVNHYKKRAFKQHEGKPEGKRKTQVRHTRVPLLSWAQLLIDSSNFEDLKTDSANALRLIAKFENIPATICTENIDFRHLYHVVANAMEGKALQEDYTIALVLDKCFTEAVLVSKAFMRNTTLISIMENYLKAANTAHKEITTVYKPGIEPAEAAIRHLATKNNYNPFSIAESNLKLE